MSDEEITEAERLEALSEMFHAVEWLKQEGQSGNRHAVTVLHVLVAVGICVEDEPGNGTE